MRQSRFHFAARLAASLVFLVSSHVSHAANPTGHFDSIASGSAADGWAWDSDQPGAFLQIDFYREGPSATGIFLGSTTADQPRPDLIGLPYENHAFHFTLPASVLDGHSHTLFAYARNVGPGSDFHLINSPKLVLDERSEVWMCKFDPWTLGTSNQWEFVKQNVDVLKLYIDEVNTVPIADLRNLVNVAKAYNIKIAIECGGLVDWRADDTGPGGVSLSAENSFLDEAAKVKRLTDPVGLGGAGGTITYLDMDGPSRRMLYPFNVQQGYHTFNTATDELGQVLQLWRQRYPSLQFMILTNFPNWGWKGSPAYHNFGYTPGPLGYGDYFPVLQLELQKANAVGIPFAGLTIDNPYDYATHTHVSNHPGVIAGIDFMARLRDIENFAEGQGLGVNLIYNSEAPGNNGTDQAYHDQTLAYIDSHMAYGATPLRYIIQSWYTHPLGYVPETSGFTMSQLTRDVILKLRPGADPVGSPVGNFDTCTWFEARGWAVDYDNPAGAVQVDLYLDGMPGAGGSLLGTALANLSYSGHTPHGFSLQLPHAMMKPAADDGYAHRIYPVARNLGGAGADALLGGAPLALGPGGFPATQARVWAGYR